MTAGTGDTAKDGTDFFVCESGKVITSGELLASFFVMRHERAYAPKLVIFNVPGSGSLAEALVHPMGETIDSKIYAAIAWDPIDGLPVPEASAAPASAPVPASQSKSRSRSRSRASSCGTIDCLIGCEDGDEDDCNMGTTEVPAAVPPSVPAVTASAAAPAAPAVVDEFDHDVFCQSSMLMVVSGLSLRYMQFRNFANFAIFAIFAHLWVFFDSLCFLGRLLPSSCS